MDIAVPNPPTAILCAASVIDVAIEEIPAGPPIPVSSSILSLDRIPSSLAIPICLAERNAD